MSFLHLWAIAIGAGALAAPVVIHLLTRPRPVRMPLSTLRFVREAIHQRRARHRLRDFVILALRTLAVALLALAVARLQWGDQTSLSESDTGDTVRVVIVDVSQSMAATDGGIEQISKAKNAAADRYLRYRQGLLANLILAGARPRAVFDGPSTNFEALRKELAQCEALPERLDAKAALESAARMLAPTSEDDQRRRELIIFSDFQRTSWTTADFSVVPADTKIVPQLAASESPSPNLAITRAFAHAQSSRAGHLLVEIEVANFTPTSHKVAVEVVLGETSRRLEGQCPARERMTLSEEMELPSAGWQSGHARLLGVDDALGADNVRALAVQLRPKPTYALVTREPASRRPSSSYFLQCALVPDERLKEKSSATIVRVDPSAVEARTLAPCDLICLDHPGKLSDDAIKALASMLRRGHPMLYVTGETIDATNLKRLVDASGAGLQMPVEFMPPPAGKARRNLVLASTRQDERSPFRVFGDEWNSIKNQLHFAGGLSSRRLESGLADDLLATYNDKSACMVLTSSGAGSLAVINADLAASNLARSGAFVPLVKELVEQMLGRAGGEKSFMCGERLVAPLPSEASPVGGLQILGPDTGPMERSGARFGELVEEGAGAAWHWASPDRPGVYCIQRNGNTVYSLAVNIDPAESNLESLSAEGLERLAPGQNLVYRNVSAESDDRDDLWKWFAVACVACMLGEMTSLLAFKT